MKDTEVMIPPVGVLVYVPFKPRVLESPCLGYVPALVMIIILSQLFSHGIISTKTVTV